ncbi:hypothetical protein E3N88_29137 [Mikania micrantha]|uniref:Uncharacterized protein n=1 Tax=Mikania micrantha TaxID=192012 RepID=A0A5N6N2I0_9ASTR|nr:hypothetical protein E3N88_29137 [Mikania micrantha]
MLLNHNTQERNKISTVTVAYENYVINDVRNDERGRKPCSKRSPGLPGIEKRRKISKYWNSGLVTVREGWDKDPPRYVMHGKYRRFARKTSRYAKPKWALRRDEASEENSTLSPSHHHFEGLRTQGTHQGSFLQDLIVVLKSEIRQIR